MDVIPAPLLGLPEAEVIRLQKEREAARALWKGGGDDGDQDDDGAADASSLAAPPPAADDEDDAAAPVQDAVGQLVREDLPACHNRDRADAVAMKFCEGLATKKAQRRLARALFACPRTALELLPQYRGRRRILSNDRGPSESPRGGPAAAPRPRPRNLRAARPRPRRPILAA